MNLPEGMVISNQDTNFSVKGMVINIDINNDV